MPLLEVTKGLVDFSKALFDVGEKLRAQDDQARARTASVLDAICTCLESIAQHARAGEKDALIGRCEELGVYLDHFSALNRLPNLVGNDPIDLLNKLADAAKARRGILLATNLAEASAEERRDALDQVQRAAGAFRATAKLLRLTDISLTHTSVPVRKGRTHLPFILGGASLLAAVGGILYVGVSRLRHSDDRDLVPPKSTIVTPAAPPIARDRILSRLRGAFCIAMDRSLLDCGPEYDSSEACERALAGRTVGPNKETRLASWRCVPNPEKASCFDFVRKDGANPRNCFLEAEECELARAEMVTTPTIASVDRACRVAPLR